MASTLTKSVRKFLLVDSRRQADRDAEEIGACLEPTLGTLELWGAYTVLKWWYHYASARATSHLWVDMAKFTGG